MLKCGHGQRKTVA